MVRPPSTQSTAETRTQTGRFVGKAARTARMISRGNRARLVKAAAVLVGAGVGERGEELVGEVAVGGVDFGEEEAGGGGAVGGSGEVGDDLVHAGAIEGLGEWVLVVKAEGGGGDDVGPAAFSSGGGVGGA